MVAFGGGRLLFEPFKLAVFESLLPNGSSQLGPPLCFKLSIYMSNNLYSTFYNKQSIYIIWVVSILAKCVFLQEQWSPWQQEQQCLHRRQSEDKLPPTWT